MLHDVTLTIDGTRAFISDVNNRERSLAVL